jgi:hypothetical protein
MAATTRVGTIRKHFRPLKDPRVVGRTRHRLIDLIVLAICGVIANCDDWPDIALFAQKREAWFRRFLALPGGVPAHDTFERVFASKRRASPWELTSTADCGALTCRWPRSPKHK